MEEQIPPGPKDKFCPLFRKRADKVCQSCMLWAKVRFENPQQDGKFVDQWVCTIAVQPAVTMDVGRRQRDTSASMQNMANELQKGNATAHASITTLVSLLNRVADPMPPMINGRHDEPKLLE